MPLMKDPHWPPQAAGLCSPVILEGRRLLSHGAPFPGQIFTWRSLPSGEQAFQHPLRSRQTSTLVSLGPTSYRKRSPQVTGFWLSALLSRLPPPLLFSIPFYPPVALAFTDLYQAFLSNP